SFILSPNIYKPNCFFGPGDLLAIAGEGYELEAAIKWDSVGKEVTSSFYAKTAIPEKFKIVRAYDLMGKPYKEKERVLFLPAPLDMRAHYYVPEYSNDVAGVLVSMVFNNKIHWGENTMTKLASQFVGEDSTQIATILAKFGDRDQVFFVRNMEIAGSQNELDSIPVIGMSMPARGTFDLLFYATTNDYVKYRDSYLNGVNDSRVEAVYNIEGGAGVFAGMLVDTFTVNIMPDPSANIKTYSYHDAQYNYCNRLDRDTDLEEWRVDRRCIEFWDSNIWREIICKDKEIDGWKCRLFFEDHVGIINGYFLEKDSLVQKYFLGDLRWDNLPIEDLREILSEEEFITWCEHRDFPVQEYPDCGFALVLFSKMNGKKSVILDRETKKWCEGHRNNAECEH
ncbi:MAG: hypothetical protein FWH22_00335, partial [Fibromonadales bacterium]|nr:hypothetical protein [Fibromonadales bacterium]